MNWLLHHLCFFLLADFSLFFLATICPQILIQNQKVEFAGYSVPHPSEPIVHIRVQTTDQTTAVGALQESCETLHEQCEYVLQQLEAKLPEVRKDSEELQKKMEEMLEDEEDDDDMMEE